MFDLIGDIHGHADSLEALLAKLGYVESKGVYRHESRKVIFLGDLIDRGPKIQRVLKIVRGMMEQDQAFVILGNHELNALAFHTRDHSSPGNYLRPHTSKNLHQHQATLSQLTSHELVDYLEWFKSLPLWIEEDGLRVVHACWDDGAIAKLRSSLSQRTRIDDEFLQQACHPGGELFSDIEIICKGKEADLPNGMSLTDKDGHARSRFRTRWYLHPAGLTYREYAFQSAPLDCDQKIDPSVIAEALPYANQERPVFIGHYWLQADEPKLLAPNVACLDYSVAKEGFLCAYRWNGDRILSNASFVW